MADGAAGTREGDWQCPNGECINHTGFPQHYVFGTKVNCSKCGTGKSASRPGDWCCPNPGCVNQQNCVYANKMQCNRCGAHRPPLHSRGQAIPNSSPTLVGGGMDAQGGFQGQMGGKGRMGDWHCSNPSCKNHTDNVVFGSKSNCPICGNPKPENAGSFAPAPQYGGGFGGGCGGCKGGGKNGRMGDWHCSNPSCKNHTDNVVFGSKSNCPICGDPKPENAGMTSPSQQPAYLGGQGYGGPAMYDGPQYGGGFGGCKGKGGGKGKGEGERGRGQPGDWHCTNADCKNHLDNVVFASKVACPICGQPKPTDSSVTFAATSRPGDWQCPNAACKNHVNGVYASKAMCNLCGGYNPNTGSAGGEARSRSRSPH